MAGEGVDQGRVELPAAAAAELGEGLVGAEVPGEELGDVGHVGEARGRRERAAAGSRQRPLPVPALTAQREHLGDLGHADGEREAAPALALRVGVAGNRPGGHEAAEGGGASGEGGVRRDVAKGCGDEGGRPPEVDHGEGAAQRDVLADAVVAALLVGEGGAAREAQERRPERRPDPRVVGASDAREAARERGGAQRLLQGEPVGEVGGEGERPEQLRDTHGPRDATSARRSTDPIRPS